MNDNEGLSEEEYKKYQEELNKRFLSSVRANT